MANAPADAHAGGMDDRLPAVYTIGYQGLDFETFLDRLRDAGVATLVDVRERPQSRKPAFSKRALAQRLEAGGIGYVHVRELGCPAAIRNRYRKEGDWSRYSREFLAWLGTQSAAVDEVAVLAGRSPVALMCFEADVERCHRLFVAQAVVAITGGEAIHLQA